MLIRSQTGVEMTDAGRFFYEKSRGILDQVDQTLIGIQEYIRNPVLRVGALPSLANFYLPENWPAPVFHRLCY